MDSMTLLHEFKDQIKIAVSFDYGSKHNAIEIYYAKRNCKQLKIPHLRIPLSFINKHFKSDLLKSGGEIPEGHYADEVMKKTVVPFRNGIMLSIAAGLAESNDCSELYIGNHFGDHAIYPDCRMDFIKPMSEAIRNGTYKEIQLRSPYALLTKREIALRGKEMKLNYDNSYSCYKGHSLFFLFGVPYADIHCGKCGTCVERIEALKGFDTTEYEDDERAYFDTFIQPL